MFGWPSGNHTNPCAPGSPGGRGTAAVCYPQAGVCSPGGENPRRLRSKRHYGLEVLLNIRQPLFPVCHYGGIMEKRVDPLWCRVLAVLGHLQALAPTVAGSSAGWIVYVAFYTYSKQLATSLCNPVLISLETCFDLLEISIG